MLTARTSSLIILSIFISGLATESHWTYDNEDEWPKLCKSGDQQSPIALSPGKATEQNFSAFIFENYDVTQTVQLKNNGHTIQIRIKNGTAPSIKGGGLPHEYIFDNMHFHWESEHTLEKTRYPLEIHIVHYSKNYPNIAEAEKNSEGIIVLGVLVYISQNDDKAFAPLSDVVDKVKDEPGSASGQDMELMLQDFLPRDTAGFYRYRGSLTTPGCTEEIIWTVFTHTLPISQNQINFFYLVKGADHKPLLKTYRSLQRLKGRKLFLSVSKAWKTASRCGMLVFVLFVQVVERFI